MSNILDNKKVADSGLEVFNSGGGCAHLALFSTDESLFFLINKKEELHSLPEDLEGVFTAQLCIEDESVEAEQVLQFLEHEGFVRPEHEVFGKLHYVFVDGSFDFVTTKVMKATDVLNNLIRRNV